MAMADSQPVTSPSSAPAEPSAAPPVLKGENYWDRIAECVALAKTAPTNQQRARYFAAAHRYLQLAQAQADSAAKPAPK
jgi:hypothetical protein